MKKKFRFFLFLAVFMIAATNIQAQEVVTTDTAPVKEWLSQYWFLFVSAIYELLVRLFPTGRTYSIITFIWKIVSTLVPDTKKGGGTHA